MSKKRLPALLPISGSVTIRYPEDGMEGLPARFEPDGVINPSGLFLRAQLRTSISVNPAVGHPVSLIKNDGDFTKPNPDTGTAGTWKIVGGFEDSDGSGSDVELGAYYLHVWAYEDAAYANLLDHHVISITIGTASYRSVDSKGKQKKKA